MFPDSIVVYSLLVPVFIGSLRANAFEEWVKEKKISVARLKAVNEGYIYLVTHKDVPKVRRFADEPRPAIQSPDQSPS